MTFFIVSPDVAYEAEAQRRKEQRLERAQDRRQKRRVRRRVRRRVTRRAHMAYRALPRYRAIVRAVPAGAVVVRRNSMVYHYRDGIFYRPQNTQFVIVRPAIGVRVKMLPTARFRTVVAGRTYFYYYGTFYIKDNDEYEVVEAPEGALADALPDGYEVKEVDGTEYYFLDGIYYQEVETDETDDGLGYEVVKLD